MTTTSETTRYGSQRDNNSKAAFNAGCNARLAGFAFSSCYLEKRLKWWWEHGWMDVDQNWGSEAKWPYKILPDVLRRVG